MTNCKKDPHYAKFIEQREKHILAADYLLSDLIKTATELRKYIRSTPNGCDYYAAAESLCRKHSATVPGVLRELMSVRIAYESWKPGPGYPSLQ